MPNTTWRALFGAPQSALGSYSSGALPKITGHFGGLIQYGPSGAFVNAATQKGNVQATANQIASWTFDASRCSSAYSRSDNTVIPQSIFTQFFIKYI